MSARVKTSIFIIAVFFISLMVEIIPLPYWGEYLRPQLVFLVLFYWLLANPYRVNLFIVLFLGLLLDFLHHVFLGEHALALIAISYFLLKFHCRIKMFTMGRQMLTVLGSLLCYEGMLLVFAWLAHDQTLELGFIDLQSQYYWLYFSNAVVSTLVWPCFAAVLYNLQKYFKIS